LQAIIWANARGEKPAVPGVGDWARRKIEGINNWMTGTDYNHDHPLWLGAPPGEQDAEGETLSQMDNEISKSLNFMNQWRLWKWLGTMARTFKKIMHHASDETKKGLVYCFSVDAHVSIFMMPHRGVTERSMISFWFAYVKGSEVAPWKSQFEECIASNGQNSIYLTKPFSLEGHRLISLIEADLSLRTVISTSHLESRDEDVTKEVAWMSLYGSCSISQTSHATSAIWRYFYPSLYSEGKDLIRFVDKKVRHLPKNAFVTYSYMRMSEMCYEYHTFKKTEESVMRLPSLFGTIKRGVTDINSKLLFTYAAATGSRKLHRPECVLAEEVWDQMELNKELKEGLDKFGKPGFDPIGGGPQCLILEDFKGHLIQARGCIFGEGKTIRWSLFSEMTALSWIKDSKEPIVRTEAALDLNIWTLDRPTASIPDFDRPDGDRERASVTESLIYANSNNMHTIGDLVHKGLTEPNTLFADGKDKEQEGDKRLFLIMTIMLLAVVKMVEDVFEILGKPCEWELVTLPNERRYEVLRDSFLSSIKECKEAGHLFDPLTIMIDLTKFGPSNSLFDYIRFIDNIKALMSPETYKLIRCCTMGWMLKKYKVPGIVRKTRVTPTGGAYPEEYNITAMGLGLGNRIGSLVTGAAYKYTAKLIRVILGKENVRSIRTFTHSDDTTIDASARSSYHAIVAGMFSGIMRCANAKEQPVKVHVNQDPDERLSLYLDKEDGNILLPPVKLMIPPNRIRPAGFPLDQVQNRSMLREAWRRGYSLVAIRCASIMLYNATLERYVVRTRSQDDRGRVYPIEAFGHDNLNPMSMVFYGDACMSQNISPGAHFFLNPMNNLTTDNNTTEDTPMITTELISPRVSMPQGKKYMRVVEKYKSLIPESKWVDAEKISEIFPVMRVAKPNGDLIESARLMYYDRRLRNSRVTDHKVIGFYLAARAASLPVYTLQVTKKGIAIFLELAQRGSWEGLRVTGRAAGLIATVWEDQLLRETDDGLYNVYFKPDWLQQVCDYWSGRLEGDLKGMYIVDRSPKYFIYDDLQLRLQSKPPSAVMNTGKLDWVSPIRLVVAPIQNAFPKFRNSLVSILVHTFFPSFLSMLEVPIRDVDYLQTEIETMKVLLGPKWQAQMEAAANLEMKYQSSMISQTMTILFSMERRFNQVFSRGGGGSPQEFMLSLYRNQFSPMSSLIVKIDDKTTITMPDGGEALPSTGRTLMMDQIALIDWVASVIFTNYYLKLNWSRQGSGLWQPVSLSNEIDIKTFLSKTTFKKRSIQDVCMDVLAIARSSNRIYHYVAAILYLLNQDTNTALNLYSENQTEWWENWIVEQVKDDAGTSYLRSGEFQVLYRKSGEGYYVKYYGDQTPIIIHTSSKTLSFIGEVMRMAYQNTSWGDLSKVSLAWDYSYRSNILEIHTQSVVRRNGTLMIVDRPLPGDELMAFIGSDIPQVNTGGAVVGEISYFKMGRNLRIAPRDQTRGSGGARFPKPVSIAYKPPPGTEVYNFNDIVRVSTSSPWKDALRLSSVTLGLNDGPSLSWSLYIPKEKINEKVLSQGKTLSLAKWLVASTNITASHIQDTFRERRWLNPVFTGPNSAKEVEILSAPFSNAGELVGSWFIAIMFYEMSGRPKDLDSMALIKACPYISLLLANQPGLLSDCKVHDDMEFGGTLRISAIKPFREIFESTNRQFWFSTELLAAIKNL